MLSEETFWNCKECDYFYWFGVYFCMTAGGVKGAYTMTATNQDNVAIIVVAVIVMVCGCHCQTLCVVADISDKQRR